MFLAQASRQQHHVMFVMGAGPGSHVTWSPLVEDNVPALAEQRADVGRAHRVGRIEPVRFRLINLDIGVMHNNQHPPARDSRALSIVAWGAQQRGVLR